MTSSNSATTLSDSEKPVDADTDENKTHNVKMTVPINEETGQKRSSEAVPNEANFHSAGDEKEVTSESKESNPPTVIEGEKDPEKGIDFTSTEAQDPNVIWWDGPDDPHNPMHFSPWLKVLNIALVSAICKSIYIFWGHLA
jgi:hypothetical protein